MKLFIISIQLLISVFCFAQPSDTTFKLFSQIVSDSFKISIAQIITTPAEKEFYPVYTLDGDETFYGTKIALHSLTHLQKNVLVISIGYGATYGHAGNMRDRDYSPIISDISPGNKFFLFISKELIPLIEKNYLLKPERTLIGYSAGANFCLYTMLINQHLFRNYLAGSIGSSLDSSYLYGKLQKINLKKMKTRLFISAGSKEDWATERMKQVIAALKPYSESFIKFKEQVFEGEQHGLKGAFVFLRSGLEWIFVGN